VEWVGEAVRAVAMPGDAGGGVDECGDGSQIADGGSEGDVGVGARGTGRAGGVKAEEVYACAGVGGGDDGALGDVGRAWCLDHAQVGVAASCWRAAVESAKGAVGPAMGDVAILCRRVAVCVVMVVVVRLVGPGAVPQW